MSSASYRCSLRRAWRALAAVGLAVGTFVVITTTPAAASQFTVTTTADSGAGSLRQAVIDANANGGPDEIVFDPSIDTQTITLTTGEIAVSDALTVTGNGATNTIIDGNSGPMFHVTGGVPFTISGSTLQHGVAPGDGGAILSDAAVTVDATTIADNSAPDGNGGGVAATAVTVRNGSMVRANQAGNGAGGGVFANTGDVTVTDSTIGGAAPSDANTSTGSGGGVSAADTATITSSTVSHNTASNAGGGVSAATVVVAFSTIGDNAACCAPGDNGGGINSGALTITDSTISSNSAFAGGGASVISPTSVTITGSWFDQNVASAGGGGIANIGALTQTMSITDSTFSANQQTTSGFFGGGGGAIATSDGDATISNVTITGNTAAGPDGGGGILVQTFNAPVTNTVSITSSTIDGNTAPVGAGIAVGTDAPATSVGSTILSNSTGPACDAAGTVTDSGFNLLSNTTPGSCVFGASNDVTGADPELGALTLNAPATLVPTMALSATSPALDRVTTGCPPPATDARGVTRPQGDACDIGAFELAVTPPPTTTTPPTATTPTTISVAPAGAAESSGGSGTLPATGGPGPGLALLGTALLVLGALLELAPRARGRGIS